MFNYFGRLPSVHFCVTSSIFVTSFRLWTLFVSLQGFDFSNIGPVGSSTS